MLIVELPEEYSEEIPEDLIDTIKEVLEFKSEKKELELVEDVWENQYENVKIQKYDYIKQNKTCQKQDISDKTFWLLVSLVGIISVIMLVIILYAKGV